MSGYSRYKQSFRSPSFVVYFLFLLLNVGDVTNVITNYLFRTDVRLQILKSWPSLFPAQRCVRLTIFRLRVRKTLISRIKQYDYFEI